MTKTKSGKVSFLGIKATQHIEVFSLTAADILALHSAPLTLVKAPGQANKVLVPIKAIIELKAGGTAFTTGGALSLVYHGATTNLMAGTVAAAVINSATDAYASFGGAAAVALTANTAIDLLAATADFAAGNGTAVITVEYLSIELGA